MITVKQVLENYDILTEKADNDSKNLVALVHAGLLDESQLPILRRAMSKPAINMTEAEKKALHGLVESVSSCIISEKQDHLSKLDTSRSMGYPPEKDIPAVIILKRKAIRVYPDNQKVALYYSQALDRYISIPYGKNSKALDMTLNEEQLDEISQETATKAYVERRKRLKDEDLTDEERRKERVKLARLSKMMRRNIETSDGQGKIRTWAGPTAVKRAKFTSASPDEQKKMAMGLSAKERAKIPGATTKAVIGALQHGGAEGIGAAAGALIGTGTRKLAGLVMKKIRGDVPDPEAKTIKPGKVKAELQKTPEAKPTETSKATPPSTPNTPVSQRSGAVRAKANMNRPMRESFRKYLDEAREYGKADAALDAASFLPGPAGTAASLASAGMSLSRGDYTGAALDVAGALPGVGYLAKGAKVAKVASKAEKSVPEVSKAAERVSTRLRNKEQRAAARNERLQNKTPEKGKWRRRLGTAANLAGAAAGALGGGGSDESLFKDTAKNYDFNLQPTVGSSESGRKVQSAADAAANIQNIRQWNQPSPSQRTQQNESNNLNILKQIVEHNISSHVIHINETPITINNRVAKKVVNVYESLNRQNKKKVEKMLNEDATSFKKIINFAVRQ